MRILLPSQKNKPGKRLSRKQWHQLVLQQQRHQWAQEIARASQAGFRQQSPTGNPTATMMPTTRTGVAATDVSAHSSSMPAISPAGRTDSRHVVTWMPGLLKAKTNVLGG